MTIGSYETSEKTITIETPYCSYVVDICRSWGGKFTKGVGWTVPVTRLADVEEQLGRDFFDLVEVEVGEDDWTGRQQIRVGWYVLAGRQFRDYGAEIYADMAAGCIPSSGGSRKDPSVAASHDAKFRFWVPRDFAEARSLEIVTDPKMVDEYDPKREAIEGILKTMVDHGITAEELFGTSVQA